MDCYEAFDDSTSLNLLEPEFSSRGFRFGHVDILSVSYGFHLKVEQCDGVTAPRIKEYRRGCLHMNCLVSKVNQGAYHVADLVDGLCTVYGCVG